MYILIRSIALNLIFLRQLTGLQGCGDMNLQVQGFFPDKITRIASNQKTMKWKVPWEKIEIGPQNCYSGVETKQSATQRARHGSRSFLHGSCPMPTIYTLVIEVVIRHTSKVQVSAVNLPASDPGKEIWWSARAATHTIDEQNSMAERDANNWDNSCMQVDIASNMLCGSSGANLSLKNNLSLASLDLSFRVHLAWQIIQWAKRTNQQFTPPMAKMGF
jgi:hypothetical protein